MSQWDKLIAAILTRDASLRFEDLYKALVKLGYMPGQPKGSSSHYTFRKARCAPNTLPRHAPMKKAYINLVSEAVKADLEVEQDG